MRGAEPKQSTRRLPPSEQFDDSLPTGGIQSLWIARTVAWVSLRLPRLSVFRLVQPQWRHQLIRRGGLPFSVEVPGDTADRLSGHTDAEAPAGGNGVDRRPPAVLDALYFRSGAGRGGKLPVVMTHGYAEVKECHHRLVQLLIRHGHDVVLFDLRAHGRSTGRATTLGAWDKHDLAAVIDEARRRGWVNDRVITMGYSTGAAAAIQHAAMDRRVAAVVAWAPFADLAGAIRSFNARFEYPMDDRALLRGFRQAAAAVGFALHESSTIEAARRLTVPVLTLVAKNDLHLPPDEHGRAVAAAIRSPGSALVEVPHANHLTIYRYSWTNVDETIVTFCSGVGVATEGGDGDAAARM